MKSEDGRSPPPKNWSKISSVLPTSRMRNHHPFRRWWRLSQMPWRAGDLESDLGWQEGPGYQILDRLRPRELDSPELRSSTMKHLEKGSWHLAQPEGKIRCDNLR